MLGFFFSKSGISWASTSPSRPIAQIRRVVLLPADAEPQLSERNQNELTNARSRRPFICGIIREDPTIKVRGTVETGLSESVMPRCLGNHQLQGFEWSENCGEPVRTRKHQRSFVTDVPCAHTRRDTNDNLKHANPVQGRYRCNYGASHRLGWHRAHGDLSTALHD